MDACPYAKETKHARMYNDSTYSEILDLQQKLAPSIASDFDLDVDHVRKMPLKSFK